MTERTQPMRMPADWKPRGPAWSAVFGERVQQIVMAYLGVQSPDGAEGPLVAELATMLAEHDTPDHVDRAHYVDEAGCSTTILVAYWLDPARFESWATGSRFAAWWAGRDGADDGLGTFVEVIAPPRDRFETIFSAPTFAFGAALHADGMGEPVREHMYWGAMRDRLPISAVDALEPGPAEAATIETSGRRVRVTPPDNLVLIRSGQGFGDLDGLEATTYHDEIEPTLRAGMDFLRDHGDEVGCITARYLRQQDLDGTEQPSTFGLCLFRSLAQLEDWAANHPTHLAIFRKELDLAKALRGNMRLQLWHEVSVVPAAGQLFEYVNCHPRTGLLNLARSSYQ